MKKGMRLTIPLMAALALAASVTMTAAPSMAASAAAAIYYAAPGGAGTGCTLANPCALNTGLGKLAAGNTLYLRGGTYRQIATINHSGARGVRIRIMSYPGEIAVIDGSAVASSASDCKKILTLSASYVTIKNLELTNPAGCGIRINSGANFNMLDRLSVHDTMGAGIYNVGNNNVIQNSKVWRVNMSNSCPAHDGCGRPYWSGGISWGDTTFANKGLNTIVRNNVVHDTYGEGIMGMYTSGARVEGNVVYDNWALGIYAANSSNFIIRNNLVYYTTNQDYWRFGTSAPAGILVADENQIPGQPNGHNRQIYNNIVVNAGYGLYFWTGLAPGAGLKNDAIFNNTIVNNLAGVGIRIEKGAHQNTIIQNNLVRVGSAASPLALSTTSGLVLRHNLWSRRPSTAGAGDVVANPQLVNPDQSVDASIDANWYKVTASSPAIDAGAAASLSADYFGAARPQGGGYDIGADEYDGAVAPAASSLAPTLSPTGTSYTAVYRSAGAADGFVVESSQTSGSGGGTNGAASTFRLGDNASDRQLRAILSFDTADLPDDATITSVVLKIKQAGSAGSNPYDSMGAIMGDVVRGPFGQSELLEGSDFQAASSVDGALSIPNSPMNGVYAKALDSAYLAYVNRAGVTQIRLRFAGGNNANGTADYLSFYTGEATDALNRPTLVIQYTVP